MISREFRDVLARGDAGLGFVLVESWRRCGARGRPTLLAASAYRCISSEVEATRAGNACAEVFAARAGRDVVPRPNSNPEAGGHPS
jgi:hypothetical protein